MPRTRCEEAEVDASEEMVKVADEISRPANFGQLTGGPNERYDATEK